MNLKAAVCRLITGHRWGDWGHACLRPHEITHHARWCKRCGVRQLVEREMSMYEGVRTSK